MASTALFICGSDQERIDYTPSGAVACGAVVIFPNFIGVCTNPEGIAANALGSLARAGTFEFNKVSGTTFAIGDPVSLDDTNNLVKAPATGFKPIGYAYAAGVSGKTKLWVAINKPLLGATP